jgi:hypothetical protein
MFCQPHHFEEEKSMRYAMAAALLAITASAHADLTHRYSFDNNANDSIGTAHGTLLNGASAGGGVLNFNNPAFPGSSVPRGYAELPVSILPTSGSVTIEQWFTFAGSGFFTEAWAFTDHAGGSNQPDADSGKYFMHTISNPQPVATPGVGGSSVAQTLAGYGGGAETRVYHTTPGMGAGGGGYLDDGQTYMAATVLDGNAGTLSYYVNGILQSTIPAISLSSYSFTNAYLGRSPFAPDNYVSGTVDEFRIYSHVVSPAGIAADFAGGPNVIPEPSSIAMIGLAGTLLRRRR